MYSPLGHITEKMERGKEKLAKALSSC